MPYPRPQSHGPLHAVRQSVRIATLRPGCVQWTNSVVCVCATVLCKGVRVGLRSASANLHTLTSSRNVEALYDAERALELNPRNWKAALWRTQALLGMYRFTAAKKHATLLMGSKEPACVARAKNLLNLANKKIANCTTAASASDVFDNCSEVPIPMTITNGCTSMQRVRCVTRTEGWYTGHRNYFTGAWVCMCTASAGLLGPCTHLCGVLEVCM